jgi:hypothetical protein
MKKYIIVALTFCFLTPGASIQAQFSKTESKRLTPIAVEEDFARVIARGKDYEKAEELMKNEKWEDALHLLQSYSIDDDIYFTDFNDAPNYFRSPKRRLQIAQCLVHIGRTGEARKELRSLFEVKVKPPYVNMGNVLTLLIDLETANGYADFEAWLNKYLPVTNKRFYRGSAQQVTSIKKDVETGRFEAGYEELSKIEAPGIYGEARLQWQQKAVLSYFERNMKSLDYILQKLDTDHRYASRGIVYSVGEMANPKAIPVLRKLKAQEQNYWHLEVLTFALAKCGDRDIMPDLYARASYLSWDRSQRINSLLSKLAGTSFGEIKNEDDAKRILEQWKQWIDKNTVEKQ